MYYTMIYNNNNKIKINIEIQWSDFQFVYKILCINIYNTTGGIKDQNSHYISKKKVKYTK